MDIGITIESNAAPNMRARSAGLGKALAEATVRSANELTKWIDRTVKIRHSGSRRGNTGDLARSYKPSLLQQVSGSITAGSFSDLIYARIQHFGGRIYPRTRKFLAIPIDPKIPRGKWPRHFAPGELFLVKGGKTAAQRASQARVLFQRLGNGRLKRMFKLVPFVTIKGSGYLDDAADSAQVTIRSIFDKAVKRTLGIRLPVQKLPTMGGPK